MSAPHGSSHHGRSSILAQLHCPLHCHKTELLHWLRYHRYYWTPPELLTQLCSALALWIAQWWTLALPQITDISEHHLRSSILSLASSLHCLEIVHSCTIALSWDCLFLHNCTVLRLISHILLHTTCTPPLLHCHDELVDCQLGPLLSILNLVTKVIVEVSEHLCTIFDHYQCNTKLRIWCWASYVHIEKQCSD